MLILYTDLQISFVAISLLPFLPASWIGLVICFNSYPVIQKYIINPYYEQRGEINPELMGEMEVEPDPEETLFEDMGGKETPIVKKKGAKAKNGSSKKTAHHKGKIIS